MRFVAFGWTVVCAEDSHFKVRGGEQGGGSSDTCEIGYIQPSVAT